MLARAVPRPGRCASPLAGRTAPLRRASQTRKAPQTATTTDLGLERKQSHPQRTAFRSRKARALLQSLSILLQSGVVGVVDEINNSLNQSPKMGWPEPGTTTVLKLLLHVHALGSSTMYCSASTCSRRRKGWHTEHHESWCERTKAANGAYPSFAVRALRIEVLRLEPKPRQVVKGFGRHKGNAVVSQR